MTLKPTVTPGYMKDPKTNVIVPNDVNQKVQQIKASRERFKEHQQMRRDLDSLREEVTKLKKTIETLVGGGAYMLKDHND